MNGIRKFINENMWVTGLVVIAVAGVAIYLAFFRAVPKQGAYFSVDDGQSWFEYEPTLAPFSHSGSEAVQAHLFTCDGGQSMFVGYLSKYDEQDKERVRAAMESRSLPPDVAWVKRPGDAEWVKSGGLPTSAIQAGAEARSAAQIKDVRCPDGKRAAPRLPPV